MLPRKRPSKSNTSFRPPFPKTTPHNDPVDKMAAILADAGCTLINPTGPPCVPSDSYTFRRRLDGIFSEDSSIRSLFIQGFSDYISSTANFRRVLLPCFRDSFASIRSDSLVRLLLLVKSIQQELQCMLLEKLPEFFDTDSPLGFGARSSLSRLDEDVARLIVNQFRWLDFLVDSEAFAEKLLQVLSVCPHHLKKEIIGSLPEIVGDQNNNTVVSSLHQMLQEDSSIIVPVLDSFSNLNLDDLLQDQVIMIALSCMRTIDAEHMPYVLKFLLLSAKASSARRIISQIREQLKFIGGSHSGTSQHSKLKGKSLVDNTEASILDALRSSLRFKNMLCQETLKELKSYQEAREHKVIDIWLLTLIYMNCESLQKSAEKLFKKKIVEGCIQEHMFDQCIHGVKNLSKDYLPIFLSLSSYLLACKEQRAQDFGIHMYISLFEEFCDDYSRQEVLGALLTHVGSGISYEVNAALDAMVKLACKKSEELISLCSHITGVLDYLEGFSIESLHKVYEVFTRLAVSAQSGSQPYGCSIVNELLMILRKQVNNSDMMYKKMGIIGTLKIVSYLADTNNTSHPPLLQRSNHEEAVELLKVSLDSCKQMPLPLILFYEELVSTLQSKTLHPAIMEWVGKHVGEFESIYLSDLDAGILLSQDSSCGLEGELWMNLDGDISPICLNIMPLVIQSFRSTSLLQVLPIKFVLLAAVERLANQGSLGGIDALLGCPFHLPSSKVAQNLMLIYYLLMSKRCSAELHKLLEVLVHLFEFRPLYYLALAQIDRDIRSMLYPLLIFSMLFAETSWQSLIAKQKQIAILSLYYAANWMRELLNAFSIQVVVGCDTISQVTKQEIMVKLLKRLRNLVFVESLLNNCLKNHPVLLPDLYPHLESLPSIELDYMGDLDKKRQHLKGAESTSQSKKRNKGKSSSPSANSNIEEKLKQPTILDIWRKAGVTTSQEGINEDSPMMSSGTRLPESSENQAKTSSIPQTIKVSAPANFLETQYHKFRPLSVDCILVLALAKNNQSSCCADPSAELPLHLYLLRDLHKKLDHVSPASKQILARCSNSPAGLLRMEMSALLNKIEPLFPYIRENFDRALDIISNGGETCQDHWKPQSRLAANPEIIETNIHASATSSSISVLRETLHCFGKILNLPDVVKEKAILADLLQAFQPVDLSDCFFQGTNLNLSPGNIDYLYSGAYIFIGGVFDVAISFSFTLASEVLLTLEFIVTSIRLFLNSSENGKTTSTGFSKEILPFISNKLGNYAKLLLMHKCDGDDVDDSSKTKGEMIQRVLRIYLENCQSTSNLLNELVCSILPQVSRAETSSQDDNQTFPTLCPATLVVWYRVMHEENLATFNNLVKEIARLEKPRGGGKVEDIQRFLNEISQSVSVVVCLINMCRVNEKVSVRAMAVKYGGKFVDSFLKVFDFLKAQFQTHKELILQLIKELQKATRTIQTLCSEAKGSKQTAITGKIPATKRSMERFLFHVKALLCTTESGCSFWMGNLKHKDLMGHVVSSQAYLDDQDDDINDDPAEIIVEDQPMNVASP